MTREEMLLTIMSEECSEIIQSISKALRFGLNNVQKGQQLSNRERFLEEITDFLAMRQMLIDEKIIDMKT